MLSGMYHAALPVRRTALIFSSFCTGAVPASPCPSRCPSAASISFSPNFTSAPGELAFPGTSCTTSGTCAPRSHETLAMSEGVPASGITFQPPDAVNGLEPELRKKGCRPLVSGCGVRLSQDYSGSSSQMCVGRESGVLPGLLGKPLAHLLPLLHFIHPEKEGRRRRRRGAPHCGRPGRLGRGSARCQQHSAAAF